MPRGQREQVKLEGAFVDELALLQRQAACDWSRIERAAADGTIVAVQDVLLELERQDDDVFAWAKRHITFHAVGR